MHRVNERLDHALGSIDLSYLSRLKAMFLSAFESFDGWSLTASASDAGIMSSYIATSAVNGNRASLRFESNSIGYLLDASKNPIFQITCKLCSSDNVEVFLGCGDPDNLDQGDCWGFKFVNGTEYAVWAKDETPYTQEISNVVTTDFHTYRVEVDNDNQVIRFYVDGVLKYTATTNYPGIGGDATVYLWIETQENVVKTLYLVDHFFSQDR
jgi:IS1 family transposase